MPAEVVSGGDNSASFLLSILRFPFSDMYMFEFKRVGGWEKFKFNVSAEIFHLSEMCPKYCSKFFLQ